MSKNYNVYQCFDKSEASYSFLGKPFYFLAFFSISSPALPDCKGLVMQWRPYIHEVVKWNFQQSFWVTLHEQELVSLLPPRCFWSRHLTHEIRFTRDDRYNTVAFSVNVHASRGNSMTETKKQRNVLQTSLWLYILGYLRLREVGYLYLALLWRSLMLTSRVSSSVFQSRCYLGTIIGLWLIVLYIWYSMFVLAPFYDSVWAHLWPYSSSMYLPLRIGFFFGRNIVLTNCADAGNTLPNSNLWNDISSSLVNWLKDFLFVILSIMLQQLSRLILSHFYVHQGKIL